MTKHTTYEKENTAPTTGAFLYPFLFPFSTSSFHFISLSCFTICPPT